ncbi:MAG: RNA polymerase sigma factor [Planctomycetota bacterium]
MSSSRARPEAPELERPVREALVRRDQAALAAFFDAYFERIHGYIRRLVREEHLAEDLTQDVFLHVHRALDSYDPERPLAPWVFTIATNKVRDLWRSRRNQSDHQSLGQEDGLDDPALVAGERSALDGLESSELASQVARAIEGLPDLLRQTLVLRYYEGLSFEAIGAIVDRNETAVRKRYSRALQELRKELGGAASGESGVHGPTDASRT